MSHRFRDQAVFDTSDSEKFQTLCILSSPPENPCSLGRCDTTSFPQIDPVGWARYVIGSMANVVENVIPRLARRDLITYALH